ncbi:MAG: recombinase family protein [Pelosinus sp.]|nr:recombinase family protein [Pelosinus sp.]
MPGAELLEKHIRVAIYVRVSTEEQAEHGYSIDAQLDKLRQHCKLYNHVIVYEYVDRGISGKEMTKRHELQKLLRDAEQGLFDEVLVWKINRMSRNTKDLLEIVEQLNKNNVYFRSFSESFDTASPMGKFALQMMGAVGELERNTIVENVKLGMKQRAKMGYRNGGSCLGYKSIEVASGELKNKKTTLEIVPEEAAIITKIFDLYVSGRGFRSIANQLNHEGCKTKKGNAFATDSIREIITNPIYIGMVRYNRFENWSEKHRRGKNTKPIMVQGKHEAIISQDIWDKAQLLFAQRSKESPRVHDSENLLTNLIKCPECGTPMVISRSQYRLRDGSKVSQRYYSCGSFKSKGSSVCHANSVRADYAEKYVLDRIKKVLKYPRILADVVKAINAKRGGGLNTKQQELKMVATNLEQLVNKKQKLLDLYEIEAIDREILEQRIEELTMEESKLYARKSEIEYEIGGTGCQDIPIDLVRQLLEKVDVVIEKSPAEQQKMLLHLVINEITLTSDRKIDKITLSFTDNLEAFLNEAPSANTADGAFARLHKGQMVRIAI